MTLDGPAAAARDAARRGLYVHVPFCARRCAYCDFSTGVAGAGAVERYLAAIEREVAVRAAGAAGAVFTSVFFGGGTPSLLAPRLFTRVMQALRHAFTIAPDAEITLEANPESVKAGLLEAWRRGGVNRLSMGAQSFDPAELEALGRLHGPGRPAEAVALARAAGFERISLDLMFGFPGHGATTWGRSLDAALALDLEHLSAYCFIPEPETPLGGATLRGAVTLPAPEVQADLYAQLEARVAAAGFGCYETSNFARPGEECRHNLVYWLRRDYLGLGPSAHGLWAGRREANAWSLEAWAGRLEAGESPCDREPESTKARADEIVMLGLRLGTGLCATDHPAAVWSEVLDRYRAAFERGVAQGRLERTAAGVRVAPVHRFVADDVIAWLMAESERTEGRAAAAPVAPGRIDTARADSLPSRAHAPQPA